MQITAISKQRNGSYDIYVDGEKVEKLDALVLAANKGIKVGAEITLDELREIKKKSGENFAFEAGIKYISRGLKTESEAMTKLLELGYDFESAKSAIEKMKSYGYINDEAYVKAYVATYGRNRGKIRLCFELARKGVSKELIDAGLTGDERVSARNLAMTKLKKYTEKEKLTAYLISRGYDFETSREVALELLEAEND